MSNPFGVNPNMNAPEGQKLQWFSGECFHRNLSYTIQSLTDTGWFLHSYLDLGSKNGTDHTILLLVYRFVPVTGQSSLNKPA